MNASSAKKQIFLKKIQKQISVTRLNSRLSAGQIQFWVFVLPLNWSYIEA